jgi:hypothetical protein
MADLSPAAVAVAGAFVAAILYAGIWYATRGLSRFAKMLAMLAPLSLLIPALLYMSTLWAADRTANAAKPPAPSLEHPEARGKAEGQVERSRDGSAGK